MKLSYFTLKSNTSAAPWTPGGRLFHGSTTLQLKKFFRTSKLSPVDLGIDKFCSSDSIYSVRRSKFAKCLLVLVSYVGVLVCLVRGLLVCLPLFCRSFSLSLGLCLSHSHITPSLSKSLFVFLLPFFASWVCPPLVSLLLLDLRQQLPDPVKSLLQ